MKKILSLALAAALCLGVASAPLAAAEVSADAPVVKVTVSQKGKLELVQQSITLRDTNNNSIYDVDDALTIAHEEYCPGGYAKQEIYTGSPWITKLWGYDAMTTGCGYYVNDVQVNGLQTAMKNGDELHAFIYRNWVTEKYSCFDTTSATLLKGRSVVLKLSCDNFGMTTSADAVFPMAFGAVSGATITIDGKSTAYQTNASGEVTIPFETAGTFVVSAKLIGDSSTIVAPVCVVTVIDPSAPVDPEDPETPVDPEDPADPETPVDPEDPADPETPVDPEKPAVPVDPIVFNDVDEDDWFYDEVQYVAEKGLMQGVGDDLFAPAAKTTRGQLVTILYRLEGEPSVADLANPFTDLSQDWYKNAVIWAADHEIVKGMTATTYAPEKDITREQTATILYRYAAYKGYDVNGAANLGSFPDAAKVSDYAKTSLIWAVEKGLITGTAVNGSTLLDPQGTAIRAQLAAILNRFCENIAK